MGSATSMWTRTQTRATSCSRHPRAAPTGAGPANFTIDQIVQLVPDGTLQFRLTYPIWMVRASDTAAVIQFDTATFHTTFHVFRGMLAQNSVHDVAVADTQYTAAGRTRQTFVSWSDAGARDHQYTAGATPETLTV